MVGTAGRPAPCKSGLEFEASQLARTPGIREIPSFAASATDHALRLPTPETVLSVNPLIFPGGGYFRARGELRPLHNPEDAGSKVGPNVA
jgi:hypothetical protein